MGFSPPEKELSNGEIKRLVPHIFLPRKLPGKVSPSLIEDESNLLRLINNVVVEVRAKCENKCLDQIVNLFYTWVNLQQHEELDPEFVTAAISALEPGDAFALYIRAQNAGFLLTFPDDELHAEKTAILSTFPAMPKLSDVMSTSGDLITVFPSSSIHIPVSDLLNSETFGCQLSILHSTSCKLAMPQQKNTRSSRSTLQEVPDPLMVSTLTTGILTNADSEVCSHYGKISKIIRDQVTQQNETQQSFRRSGLWMVAKVVLQLSLINGLNKTDGLLLYKMIMLRLMSFCCHKLTYCGDTDLCMQMLAKLARRVRKLEKYHAAHKISAELNATYMELQKNVVQSMENAKEILDHQWMTIISEERKNSLVLPAPTLHLQDDTRHLLNRCKKYFSSQTHSNSVKSNQIPRPKCPPRHLMNNVIASQFPLSHFDTEGEEELGIVLCEFELYVRRMLEKCANAGSSQYVRCLLEKYVKRAKKYYLNDPVGSSRMILASLKIIQVLDKIAVCQHALLQEHKSGVNTDIVQDLLLPHRGDLELAQELELYFNDRNKSKLPSLIEQQTVSSSSFSARFAESKMEMAQLRATILADSERAISAKRGEVARGKIYCEGLRTRSSVLSHDSITRRNRWGCLYTFHPKRTCTKCSLDRQADQYKVTLYERPLPSNKWEQNAVVFELLIPDEIASLRDSLYFFNTELCSVDMSSGNSIKTLWVNYGKISCYRRGKEEHINLGTTRGLATSANSSRSPEIYSTDDFIVNNGFNCQFAVKSACLSHQGNATVKNLCSFSTSTVPLYKDLDKWLKNTSHHQNEVLAKQSECPHSMSLTEFKEFGSLRAGHRLQLRNIYRAMQQESLSFHKEPVFSLICQSIWQAGPPSKANLVSRESHEDLAGPNFATALLKLLNEILNQQSENWTNYFTMLTIIVLTIRILALNHDVKEEAVNLLLECRRVAKSWIQKVEKVLSEIADFPKDRIEELRQNLINVCLCTALTYWVDQSDIPLIMRSASDIEDWLSAITLIKDNIILNTENIESLPHSLRNLLRWIRTAGIMMEDHLHTLLEQDSAGLDDFIKSHWFGSKEGSVASWNSCKNNEKHLYHSVFENDNGTKVILNVDLIYGNFLLNGCPVGHLPPEITNHKDYHRVFSNIVFEVQPASSQLGTYITTLKYHNSDYTFALLNGSLVVTEIQDNGNQYQLVPHHTFEGDMPFLLVNEYSHWWCKVDNTTTKVYNTISFRPISFSDKEFQHKVSYILDLKWFTIIDKSTNNLLIDINSTSYKQLLNITERMEHKNYIHMFSKQNGKALIELPRMALQFEIDQQSDGYIQMLSVEYPGKKVAKEQKFGSFVGLTQGLLLESTNSSIIENAVFLIPHGVVGICPGTKHQCVKIDLTAYLRDPPYFAFEVDRRLCELRAGQTQSGWVYLALLHAASASPMPDPFNSLTGTEAALRLLQSPRCWSCKPLEKEVKATLEAIAKISPCRKYYPTDKKYSELVKWPKDIGDLAANDGYNMLVQALLQESKRLYFLNKSAEHCEDNDTVSKSEDEDAQDSLISDGLIEKSYWRSRYFYTEQARVFFEPQLQFLKIPPPTKCMSSFSLNLDDEKMRIVRTMAHLGHTWSCELPKQNESGYLIPLLTEDGGKLTGLTDLSFCPVDLIMILNLNFRQSWLDLYNFAQKVTEYSMESEWTLLLSTMAFAGIPLEQLQLLHCVAVNSENFQLQNPPPYVNYTDCNQNDFNSSTITSHIKSAVITFDEFESRCGEGRKYGEEEWEYKSRKSDTEQKYLSKKSYQVAQLHELVKKQWPTKECIITTISNFDVIILEKALPAVNSTLSKWYMNRELMIFLQETENIIFSTKACSTVMLCHKLTLSSDFPERYQHSEISDVCMGKLTIPHDEFVLANEAEDIYTTGYLLCGPEISTADHKSMSMAFPWTIDQPCKIGSTYMKSTKESWDAYHERARRHVMVDSKCTGLLDQLRKKHSFYSEAAKAMWLKIRNVMLHKNDSFENKSLISAGLFPRITPTTILPLLFDRQLDENLRNLIGATAVLWTLEQRANRCLKYLSAEGGPMEVPLKKELNCRGHENWSPRDKPEWLLLELEMDLMIRPVQVEVANAMLNPENNKHAVMQLNMGEGKTTVIIPMVAATLGSGEHLCRITVLKSLFHMNLSALVFKLGGLLKRRVYTFPCRRDMIIDKIEANAMLQMYKECTAMRGVVMTLPEYRLSFELKGHEKCRIENLESAQALLEVQQWLKQNARDILDESDEILHVKYQLVYTVGEQLLVNGGNLRWKVAQRLLKLIPPRLEQLMRRNVNAAECNKNIKHPECFPHCRLLKLNCYQELCEMLVADILKGDLSMELPDLKSREKKIIANFLIKAEISDKKQKKIAKMLGKRFKASFRDILLILRGLLAYGVLSLVLSKRWKVNFGINHKGNRLMAVPFRAKDVPAERTEFGHPDIAILSTILSYYYSGLTENQLDQCFEILYLQDNCDEEYEQWTAEIININSSITRLSGINLSDYEQRTKCVYPVLLKNKAVIDFWLDRVVFPKEAKQFAWKMTCSAWDLCSDEAVHPVTGFSGTNDSKLLLPLNISQKDLSELLGTSGEVLHKLLLPENNNYKALEAGTTNAQILTLLVEAKIHLLLDVGALMVEYDNKSLACKWLEQIPIEDSKEAAIYFDVDDKLVVTDRQGRTNLLELSSFRGRMDKCVIYLDDFHTRGTDLKIPRGTKGCVSLGKGITKDKLVQGCMRMRMLGEGHTICFWASKEVDDEITSLCGSDENLEKNKAQHVLAWAMENSRLATRDGFPHWSASGFNYLQKNVAHMLFDQSHKMNSSFVKLGERCTDSEIVDLMEVYGTARRQVLIHETATSRLNYLLSQFSQSNLLSNELGTCSEVQTRLKTFGERIVNQCILFLPEFKRISSLLDEEQERELEQELEEEREIQRPRAARPSSPSLADGVVKYVQDGVIPTGDTNNWCVKLPLALQSTALWPKKVQKDFWGQNIFATNDFVHVVKNSSEHEHYSLYMKRSKKTKKQINDNDEFLRSPTWIAALKHNNQTILLLLSPFEVNQLLSIFRSGNVAAVLHMYAPRMHLGQDNLFQCPLLTVPPNKVLLSNDEYSTLNANLSLFSGNLYFADKKEQDDYVSFLGLVPNPCSKEEQQVIDEAGTCNGFVKAEYRERLPHITSLFLSNPVDLVRGVIDRRYEYFPSMSHIAKIVLESKKPIKAKDECCFTTDNTVDLFDNILDGALNKEEDKESGELTDEDSDTSSDKLTDEDSDRSSDEESNEASDSESYESSRLSKRPKLDEGRTSDARAQRSTCGLDAACSFVEPIPSLGNLALRAYECDDSDMDCVYYDTDNYYDSDNSYAYWSSNSDSS